MEPVLVEWVSLLLRWLHLVAGMAWIGASFYFMHIDASLRPTSEIPAGKGGEAWEVHGGGFYRVRKYLVAPDVLPKELIWHKWQSYTTWISGFLLLVWVYYLGASLYLIDPAVWPATPAVAAAIGIGSLIAGWAVYDGLCRSPLGKSDLWLAVAGFALVVGAAWGYGQVFGGRAALLHTGALMATWMSGNVAMLIIPNQRKVIAALLAGQAPDPALGKAAKQRSSHNNYLTLPVVLLMLSGHYPLTYASGYGWAIAALVLIAGGVIRHFYNERHAGRGDLWWTWLVAAVCVLMMIWISQTATPGGRAALGLAPKEPAPSLVALTAAPEEVAEIVLSRCAMCHASSPAYEGIGIAPKGVLLDTPENIQRQAGALRVFAVMTNAMPPHNITEMTIEERTVLARWLDANAPTP
jgi:uncharacterized membrane protein